MANIRSIFREVFAVLKETIGEWSSDNAFRMSAALAYYTIFSMGPALLLGLWIAGAAVGLYEAKAELFSQLKKILNPEATDYIYTLLNTFWRNSTEKQLPLIGIAIVLLAATAVFAELHSSLNSIWGVRAKRGNAIWHIFYERAISFVFVVGIGALLIFSIATSMVLGAMNTFFSGFVQLHPHVLQMIDPAIAFVMVPVLLALTYKLVPDVEIAWKDVWLGSAVASIIFLTGKHLFELYLRWCDLMSVYGAAGSLVILIAWVDYSAQVFFLGAEITKVYARRYGSMAEAFAGARPFENDSTLQLNCLRYSCRDRLGGTERE